MDHAYYKERLKIPIIDIRTLIWESRFATTTCGVASYWMWNGTYAAVRTWKMFIDLSSHNFLYWSYNDWSIIGLGMFIDFLSLCYTIV